MNNVVQRRQEVREQIKERGRKNRGSGKENKSLLADTRVKAGMIKVDIE